MARFITFAFLFLLLPTSQATVSEAFSSDSNIPQKSVTIKRKLTPAVNTPVIIPLNHTNEDIALNSSEESLLAPAVETTQSKSSDLTKDSEKSKFSMKSRVKSAVNVYSTDEKTNNMRLRLEPKWKGSSVEAGFRQDIKGKYGNTVDETKLANTRAYVGPLAFKVGERTTFQPRAEFWFPTNTKDREEKSYTGSPGFALFVKTGISRFSFNYELNALQNLYSMSNTDPAKDKFDYQQVYNEVEGKVKVVQGSFLKSKLKLHDKWTRIGVHKQEYEFELGVGYNFSKTLSFEIGHETKKALLGKNGERLPMVFADSKFSNAYGELTYIF